MTSIHEVLERHHRHCDELFAQADLDAGSGDLASAQRLFEGFRSQMQRHFECEERALFPAFERATGSQAGPTAVMRAEHVQMRELFDQGRAAIDAQDAAAWQGIATTLLILMGQHNHKEERILYPMCEAALAGEAEALAGQIRSELEAHATC